MRPRADYEVYDGTMVRLAESGHKLHFLPTNKYRPNKLTTLNCIFEFPGKAGQADGGSGGMVGPMLEYLGLWTLRQPPFVRSCTASV